MKRVVLLVSIILFLFAPFTLYAQESTEVPRPTPITETVEYELPYPGILPGNPLYIVKAFRDRVVGMLIADPVKKAEYALLNADKRMYAGVLLVDEKKYAQALDTISKGHNYMHEAVGLLKTATDAKKDVNPLYEKMDKSLQKHEEVMKKLIDRVDKESLSSFENELERVEEFQKTVSLLSPGKKK